MRVNGWMRYVKVMANKPGLSRANTRGTGRGIRLMDMESYIMQTVMCMKATGKMTKQMDKEHISILMVLSILVSGLRINSMALELRSGLTVPSMRASILKARKMEKAS